MDLTTMERACASTERVLAEVAPLTPEDYGRATPCTAWDVRALLNHVLGTLSLGAALLSDAPPVANMAPGGLPDVDLVGDDPIKAYRRGTEELLAAAADDALARPHPTPLGDMPGAVLGGFTTLDIAVHGWDLAKALGHDASLDPDLAEQILGFAHQTITDATRAPRIGAEITIGPGASPTDRLVAYLGRQP